METLIKTERQIGVCLAVLFSGILLLSPGASAATTVVAQHSNKCLDVRGGPAANWDGAAIEQWSCSGQDNQSWTLTDTGNGEYQFIAEHSGKCMEVTNGQTANGAGIQQATCTGAPRQLWNITSLGSGNYQIVNIPSGRCLDVTGGPLATGDGVFTELWDCTGQANQSWALTVPEESPQGSQPKPLVAKHSGKCLDVRGGPTATQNGALIEQWSCSGQANQNWILRDTGSGKYEIVAESSGKCIQTINGGTANMTGVEQSDCTGAANQQWYQQSTGVEGEYTFIHVPSGRCLDVTGGPSATGEGVLTELWDCTSQANQTWTIGAASGGGTGGSGGGGSATGPYGQDASQYTLVFSDEFDNGFDTGVWNDHIWYGSSNPTINYTVENGVLKIWPQRDASGNFFDRTIDTDGKYYQQYGYFEIEAKLPKGKGTWPAFWLFAHPGSRRPEIDIMEAYAGGAYPWGYTDSQGVSHPQAYGATTWKGDYEGQQVGFRQYDTGMDLSADFHRYAVKWDANGQTFYFDGTEILYLDVHMPDQMYIMLDLWFGSASGTPDSSTPQGKSNSYEINYVRAWQFN